MSINSTTNSFQISGVVVDVGRPWHWSAVCLCPLTAPPHLVSRWNRRQSLKYAASPGTRDSAACCHLAIHVARLVMFRLCMYASGYLRMHVKRSPSAPWRMQNNYVLVSRSRLRFTFTDARLRKHHSKHSSVSTCVSWLPRCTFPNHLTLYIDD